MLSKWGKAMAFAASLVSAVPLAGADESERFKDVEIRVIRPRYFTKAGRLEIGAALNTIMNESFIYTFLGTGLLTYHFNETLAIEGTFAYGLSIDREDKRILFDEFDIKTQIFRTSFMSEVAVQYTPIYGKWQLPSGKLVYFDTYLQAGVGTTGVEWRYNDFCEPPDKKLDPTAEDIPKNTTKSYPTFMAGVGQRYFVSRKMAYKWDLRANRFNYTILDGECSPIKAKTQQGLTGTAPHDTITLLIGVSYYL
ncbi:MAG TPA: outer membrane beta-barrel domain-containing protein [Oligoflexus sp.]|uniref:outer membrane beta-barrel domain-containing protein n=1 Tax=Oligoflexus sp. TaxID=1971216 RepID=UPI002D80AD4E|nr:outer membrane beta-barrel domain-containing protein [Oligoflexus sp.]HET9239275.1 outer membrane beta-barrel domain-containing protein [Oligoflexus sp.]